MVELIIIILIIGILAAVAGPRFFELDAFRARGFYDEALAALHHAQKIAIAQRRAVYVRLDGATEIVTACYTSSFPCATADQVPGPYGEKPYTVTAASGVDLQTTGTYFFDALGRPYNNTDAEPNSTFDTLTVTITGGGDTRTITMERETGYAH
jgi:MSHA pilin protein MshC